MDDKRIEKDLMVALAIMTIKDLGRRRTIKDISKPLMEPGKRYYADINGKLYYTTKEIFESAMDYIRSGKHNEYIDVSYNIIMGAFLDPEYSLVFTTKEKQKIQMFFNNDVLDYNIVRMSLEQRVYMVEHINTISMMQI